MSLPDSRAEQTAALPPNPARCPAVAAMFGSGGWLVPLLVGLGVYAVLVAVAANLLNDGDTLSHIVTGRWIIEHRALPYRDPFSYTLRGSRWVPHEWLAEIVFAKAYAWLGWGGVVAIACLAAAAAFALLTHALQRSLGPRRAVIGAGLALLLTEPHLLARPHVLALPLLVVWMAAVIRARDTGRVPSLMLLPVVTLWCNLHGGFVYGLFFTGLLAAEAVLQLHGIARRRAAAGWGAFLAGAMLAALISPNGVDLFTLPLRMLRMTFALSALSEWHAADFQNFQPLEIWIMLAILGGFSLGLRLPWTRTAMVLLLLHLSLTHVRNTELLGIIGPLLIAAPLAAQLGAAASDGGNPPRRPDARGFAAALIAGAAAMAMVVGCWATAVALDRRGIRPSEAVAPVAAVEAAHKAGLDGHVLNAIRFGGSLMLAGVPTFVDGRADLFGDEFLARAAAAESGIGTALPDLLAQYAVSWTIFAPSSPAVSLLDHLAGWERVYADPFAVVHQRLRHGANAGRSASAR